MEDVAADRAISGNSSSAQIDPDPMCLTSFGDDFIRSSVFPYPRDDALVNKDAAAPKPCLSPVEMRTLKAVKGLLPAGKSSTATRIVSYQPRLWFCPTEEINSRTTVQYAMDYSSLLVNCCAFMHSDM